MYGCGGSDSGLDGAIFKQEVGIGWLPKLAQSAPPPRNQLKAHSQEAIFITTAL